MSRLYPIEYQLKPHSERLFWAFYGGTKKDAEESARDLMCSLRYESGFKKAKVYFNGKALRLRKHDVEIFNTVEEKDGQ